MRRARNARNCCQRVGTVAGPIVLRCGIGTGCDTIPYTLPRATAKYESASQAGNMSLKKKFKRWIPFQEPLLEMPPATDVPPKERAQVAQLIANGKAPVAVDIAKAVHKRLGNEIEEHTSELQSRQYLVCRLLLEKK